MEDTHIYIYIYICKYISILHLPPNTFELNTFFEMEAMGGPPLSSLRCYCRSALFRASFSTIVAWESQLQSLKAI